MAVYLAGLEGQYYGDDYQHVLYPPSSDAFYFFTHPNPENAFLYRPIEALALTVVQNSFGLNPVPVHILILALHVLMSWLVLVGMLDSGFAQLQSLLAAGFMLVSQANALAVLSDDTLSQVAGAFFGCASLWFAYTFSRQLAPLSSASRFCYARAYILSLLTFSLSVFSKETSLGFLPMLAGIVLLSRTKQKSAPALKTALVEVIPFLFVFLLYFAARWHAGVIQAGAGLGRYGFNLGVNVLVNLGLFVIAALVPTSSVTTFLAVAQRESVAVAIILVVSLGLLAGVAYGLGIGKRHRTALILAGLALISLFPVLLTNRVSELYIYNAMPFVSALFGLGVGELISWVRTSWVVGIIAFGLILLLFSHVFAIQGKAALLKANGERSTDLLKQIEPYLPSVPSQGRLVLLNSSVHQIAYSEYLLPDFYVLDGGLRRLNRLAGRDDFVTEIVDRTDPPALAGRDQLVLQLVGSEVSVYEGEQ